MTPTERLRRMLDERGVKWWPDTYYKDTNTCWRIGGFEWRASKRDDKLLIGGTCTKYLTPEEAVAITLPESDAGVAFDEERYSKVCRLLEQALATMSEWGT